jgi:deoxyribonuclease V
MNIKNIHSWNVSYEKARGIQESLRQLLIEEPLRAGIHLVAGADVSYEKHGDLFFAGVVVWDMNDGTVVEECGAMGRVKFPYIPGLLSFREAPVLLKAFRKVKTDVEAVIVDGQGIAHPRGFGLAAHVSYLLDIPGVGCAKTRLVGNHREVGTQRGDFADLIFDGRKVGIALRTKDGVKPVFVSPGQRMDIKSAAALIIKCTKSYRLPEPIRLAHQFVNRLRREANA